MRHERRLRSDELAGDETTATLCGCLGQRTEEADQLVGGGDLGLDVVPLVVGVGAREGLAARDGGVSVKREHLLDAVVVVWVDDSADIEVVHTSPAIEGDLAEHAWDISGILGDGVPVANPSGWEGLVGSLETLEGELGDRLESSVLSEDDGALSRVLVDEVHRSGQGGGSEEEKA